MLVKHNRPAKAHLFRASMNSVTAEVSPAGLLEGAVGPPGVSGVPEGAVEGPNMMPEGGMAKESLGTTLQSNLNKRYCHLFYS